MNRKIKDNLVELVLAGTLFFGTPSINNSYMPIPANNPTSNLTNPTNPASIIILNSTKPARYDKNSTYTQEQIKKDVYKGENFWKVGAILIGGTAIIFGLTAYGVTHQFNKKNNAR